MEEEIGKLLLLLRRKEGGPSSGKQGTKKKKKTLHLIQDRQNVPHVEKRGKTVDGKKIRPAVDPERSGEKQGKF